MTQPRAVLPNKSAMLTRRCTQRQFLLRPDAETNNAYLYCLIEAAQKFGVQVVLAQMMSNHGHASTYDPAGNLVEFYHRFHTHLAKCVNMQRGRWENMWCVIQSMAITETGPSRSPKTVDGDHRKRFIAIGGPANPAATA